jgi:ABC-type transporter MlaC component
VMRNTGSGWRSVDVLADGAISRVAVQQSDFRRLLSRGGAPALAESLGTKSLVLSDPTSAPFRIQ